MEKIETAMSEGAACDGAPAKKRSQCFKAGVRFWIDVLAFLTFAICAVSGWVLMAIRPSEHGAQTGLLNTEVLWGIPRYEWMNLHNLIGWIFVALVAVHLASHWRWVVRACSSTSSTGQECKSTQKLQTELSS
jgi:hypothetical protein